MRRTDKNTRNTYRKDTKGKPLFVHLCVVFGNISIKKKPLDTVGI